MKSDDIEFNPSIGSERLRQFQKEKKYTDAFVAHIAGVTVNYYKNRKKASSKIKTISKAAVRRLAKEYDCQIEYLTGKTNDRYLVNSKGIIVTSPLEFFHETHMSELTRFLAEDENSKLCSSLHFLCCKLPPDISSQFIDAINTYIQFIKDNSALYNDYITNEQYKKLLNCALSSYSKEYTRSMICLHEGDIEFKKGRYKSCLAYYLRILLLSSSHSDDFLNPVCDKLIFLHHDWKKFPHELDDIIEAIPAIIKNHQLSNKQRKQIEIYLKIDNNPSSIDEFKN